LDEPVEALNKKSEIAGIRAADQVASSSSIRFSAVTVRYANRDTDALSDVSLQIDHGRHVAFVGASGSGKSTAIALLAGFYEPQSGDILLGGVSTQVLGVEALRRQVALVAQDVLLINDSISANIAFGVAADEINTERVRWAAEAAGAAAFIALLPGGYNAKVGEGGGLLSGGQRQRISIARALYKGSPIVLFDEATSALDTESERIVQDSLRVLGRSHTVIQVAHRLSSIRDADEIFVFEQGKLVEHGDHASLVKLEGVYSRLLSGQAG
jgi:subfamily B ATP-binding cassette protein MsbA